MAAMKRERQFDMFDVATGVCELDDYLTQRYSENDISSKFWIEPADQVDELRPPQDGQPVIIPIQGPNVTPINPVPVVSEPLPSRPPWEQAPSSENALPTRPSWEAARTPAASDPAVQTSAGLAPAARSGADSASPAASSVQGATPVAPDLSTQDPAVESAAAPVAPLPPSMAELLAQFHQAAKAYEDRAKDEPPG